MDDTTLARCFPQSTPSTTRRWNASSPILSGRLRADARLARALLPDAGRTGPIHVADGLGLPPAPIPIVYPARPTAEIPNGDGAPTVSLIASCEMHGIEPWAYLRDLLHLLPDWPKNRILELAPAYWQQTLQQDEAKGRLDANPLRRALLAFVR